MLGNSRRQNWENLTMRTWPIYKGMPPPSTQNLKTLSLWVFFLYVAQLSHSYSMFSFLLNVRLRLILGYLTNLPLK